MAGKPSFCSIRLRVLANSWAVSQVRRGLSACVVFLPFPIFWIAYNQVRLQSYVFPAYPAYPTDRASQILNNLLSQAATMELHGVPNDLLQNLNPLAIIILIPIMDFIVYPFFRKIKLVPCALSRGDSFLAEPLVVLQQLPSLSFETHDLGFLRWHIGYGLSSHRSALHLQTGTLRKLHEHL